MRERLRSLGDGGDGGVCQGLLLPASMMEVRWVCQLEGLMGYRESRCRKCEVGWVGGGSRRLSGKKLGKGTESDVDVNG